MVRFDSVPGVELGGWQQAGKGQADARVDLLEKELDKGDVRMGRDSETALRRVQQADAICRDPATSDGEPTRTEVDESALQSAICAAHLADGGTEECALREQLEEQRKAWMPADGVVGEGGSDSAASHGRDAGDCAEVAGEQSNPGGGAAGAAGAAVAGVAGVAGVGDATADAGDNAAGAGHADDDAEA
eukprot:6187962-Pleurochrysis_carterae.AAC.2